MQAVAGEDPPVLQLFRERGWPTGIQVDLGERAAGWRLTPEQARALAARLVDLAEQAERTRDTVTASVKPSTL